MAKYKIGPVLNITNKVNKMIFPLPLRCLIVGTSGCGKTTLVYNLIVKDWGIPFRHLYIFSKSLEQDIYKELKAAYDELLGEEDMEIAYFFNSCEELISVDECELTVRLYLMTALTSNSNKV